jgi:hypothetical protein
MLQWKPKLIVVLAVVVLVAALIAQFTWDSGVLLDGIDQYTW